MKVSAYRNKSLAGFVCSVIFAPLAILATAKFPPFRSIPWTLSYLAVAFATQIGGTGPAVVVMVIASAGIYRLVLAPAETHFYDSTAWIQTGAFYITASFISYLVSQRKKAVWSLQASELHYRSVTETASDVIVTIDEDSRILSINPSVKPVFGYDPDELIGGRLVTLMPERLRSAHTAGIARHLSTGERHISWNGVQLPGMRKDGKEIPLEISFAALPAGEKMRFTGFIRDVSERHRAHTALVQSEKLAAVGRLTSSIAHEINNPLAAVTNLLFLARSSADLSVVQSLLETTEQEVHRIAVIANQTLQFHKQSVSPVPVKCEEVLDGSLTLFKQKLATGNIEVRRRYRARRAAYCVDGEIRQVLNNLIANAVDALPKGGRLLLRSRDGTDWKTGRTGIVLTIADTGTGISREIRSHIFDAFYSTKGGAGAGLGLWVCAQLIARNVGMIQVKSSQRAGSTGTVFMIFLPDGPEK